VNPVIPSDVPYIVGLFVLIVAAVWLIGRAADRGYVARYGDLVLTLLMASFFVATAIIYSTVDRWLMAAMSAAMAMLGLVGYWRRRQAR